MPDMGLASTAACCGLANRMAIGDGDAFRDPQPDPVGHRRSPALLRHAIGQRRERQSPPPSPLEYRPPAAIWFNNKGLS
jgi:hypothetical protein